MDFSVIIDALANQGIWCLLFVYLFWTSREESKGREERLMGIIESYSETMAEITDALNYINEKVDAIGDKIKA